MHQNTIQDRCAHHAALAAFADAASDRIIAAFTSRAWLGSRHAAALAGALQCPILLLHPGLHGPSQSNYFIRPLGQPAASYANKTPLLLFFTHAGPHTAPQAQPRSFRPGHFCPGFLRDASHYNTL